MRSVERAFIDIGMHAHRRAVDDDLRIADVARRPFDAAAAERIRQELGTRARAAGDRCLGSAALQAIHYGPGYAAGAENDRFLVLEWAWLTRRHGPAESIFQAIH